MNKSDFDQGKEESEKDSPRSLGGKMKGIINIGFGNVVMASRIISIVAPKSLPIKRLREEARKQGKLIDATSGRQTRAILIMDSGHIVLSALHPTTIIKRLGKEELVSEEF